MTDENQAISPVTAPIGNGASWLTNGFEYFRRDWLAWVGVTIIYIVISIAAAFIPVLGNLALTVFFPVFAAGLMLGCRAQDTGEDFSISYLFAGFSEKIAPLCIVGVLYIVFSIIILVMVGILAFVMFGGTELLAQIDAGDMNALMENSLNFLLVILIGLALFIPVIMAIWFAPALIVLQDQEPLTAMKLSFMGCLLNVLPLLLYGLVGLVFSIIATIPFGLGWLILGPMYVVSIYLAYKDIYVSPESQNLI